MLAKRLIRISYFAMLAVIGALVRYPCEPIPFTLQAVLAVLAGLTIGAIDGMYSQLAYVIIGLIGLPVFANGGGYAYVLEPSFGYVAALVLGAYLSGIVIRRFKTLKVWNVFVSGLSGLGAIYVVGMIYQVIIFVFLHGYAFAEALYTLAYIPVMFAIHAALILVIAIILPRAKTGVGSIIKEKFKENGTKSEPAVAQK